METDIGQASVQRAIETAGGRLEDWVPYCLSATGDGTIHVTLRVMTIGPLRTIGGKPMGGKITP